MHHDTKDLGLICLVKKHKIHFWIFSDLKIQSPRTVELIINRGVDSWLLIQCIDQHPATNAFSTQGPFLLVMCHTTLLSLSFSSLFVMPHTTQSPGLKTQAPQAKHKH